MIRDLVHQRFLEAKRFRHFVYSSRFERILNRATDKEKNEIHKLVEEGNYEILKKYIDQIDGGNIMQLRFLAKHYGVKDYYTLTKDQLVKAIKDAKERLAKGIK